MAGHFRNRDTGKDGGRSYRNSGNRRKDRVGANRADAKAAAAGRITLGGNIEARVLECEGVDAVERACRAAFEGGAERMVFQTTAGPYCAMTPQMVANYHRLIDVWEELSPITSASAAT